LKNWAVNSSRVVLEDQWIRVRSESCVTPSGKLIEPYYVLDYSNWVTIFPVTRNNELIAIRQYRHGLGKVLLELPGGVIESGESTIEAAKRELREETGYSDGKFSKLQQLSANPANHSNLSHVLLATDIHELGAQDLDDSEDIEVELIPLDRVISETMNGSFMHATHVAAIFLCMNQLPGVRVS